MEFTDQLLTVARIFCEAKQLSLSRVSTLVFNEGKKLDAIESKGADLSTGRYLQAMRWFSDNWPADANWPSSIDRPGAPIPEPAQ